MSTPRRAVDTRATTNEPRASVEPLARHLVRCRYCGAIKARSVIKKHEVGCRLIRQAQPAVVELAVIGASPLSVPATTGAHNSSPNVPSLNPTRSYIECARCGAQIRTTRLNRHASRCPKRPASVLSPSAAGASVRRQPQAAASQTTDGLRASVEPPTVANKGNARVPNLWQTSAEANSEFADHVYHIRGTLQEAVRDGTLNETVRAGLLDSISALERKLPPAPVRPKSTPALVPIERKGTKRRLANAKARAEVVREYEQLELQWRILNEEWRLHNATKARIIHNLRNEVQQSRKSTNVNPSPGIQRLPWRFLPPAELTEARLIQSLREYRQRNPTRGVDAQRLRDAFRLKPKAVYVGVDEFDGYFAFVYGEGRQVLLEHPIIGNAAYVFGRNWRELSSLTKARLRSRRRQAIRVVHLGDWKSAVKTALAAIVRRTRSRA
jgi:hypothetical protein